MELIRSSISIVGGLPRVTVRSAPAITFSGPAQRSLTLWPARSRSRLATLYTESSDSFVASAAASIATGWSEPVPGREFHPLKSSAFHGALLRQLTQRAPAQMGFCARRSMLWSGFVSSRVNSVKRHRPWSLTARTRRFPLRVLPRTGINILAVAGSPSCISESKNQPSFTGLPRASMNSRL